MRRGIQVRRGNLRGPAQQHSLHSLLHEALLQAAPGKVLTLIALEQEPLHSVSCLAWQSLSVHAASTFRLGILYVSSLGHMSVALACLELPFQHLL